MSEIVTRETPTYLWLTGHVRNVGDSMLRRPLADLYREAGPIRVWSGAPGSGYEKGLRISEAESAKSFLAWISGFYVDAVRSRPTFVFNAGEFGVTKAYFFGLLILAPALVLSRLKGSRTVWVGAGVKNRRRFFTWPFDILAKSADSLMWRDLTSTSLMGRGEIMPDWGFGLGPAGGSTGAIADVGRGSRQFITIALRGDRQAPSSDWLDAVARLAVRLDRNIACVVQVEDDDSLARELAKRLGAKLVAWRSDGDHWAQEQRVRDIYADSELVLSDRLHGLIMAATEGAIPLGWCEATTHKVSNHFNVIDADWVGPKGASVIDEINELDHARIDELALRTADRIREARRRVDAVRARLLAAESA